MPSPAGSTAASPPMSSPQGSATSPSASTHGPPDPLPCRASHPGLPPQKPIQRRPQIPARRRPKRAASRRRAKRHSKTLGMFTEPGRALPNHRRDEGPAFMRDSPQRLRCVAKRLPGLAQQTSAPGQARLRGRPGLPGHCPLPYTQHPMSALATSPPPSSNDNPHRETNPSYRPVFRGKARQLKLALHVATHRSGGSSRAW